MAATWSAWNTSSNVPLRPETGRSPGYWEADLIPGKGASVIGALVGRSTRLPLLFRLERITSEHVVAELPGHIQALPEQLRRSVIWDQGKEVALHANFTFAAELNGPPRETLAFIAPSEEFAEDGATTP